MTMTLVSTTSLLTGAPRVARRPTSPLRYYTGQLEFTNIHPEAVVMNDHTVTPAPFSFAPAPLREQNLCEGAISHPTSPATARPTRAPTDADSSETFFEENQDILLGVGIPVALIIICLALTFSGILTPCWKEVCSPCESFCNANCRNDLCDFIRDKQGMSPQKAVFDDMGDLNRKGLAKLFGSANPKNTGNIETHHIELETARLTKS